MNFNFAEKINPSLEDFNFDAALQIAEAELKLLPVTAFHAVCGRSLVYGAKNLATWIDDFYHQAKKRCNHNYADQKPRSSPARHLFKG